MTKEAPSMELLAAAPQLLSSHAEAQGAVMSAMLSEIECWRSLAAAGCLSSAPPEPKRLSVGSKRRASESIDRRDKEKDAKEVCNNPNSHHPRCSILPDCTAARSPRGAGEGDTDCRATAAGGSEEGRSPDTDAQGRAGEEGEPESVDGVRSCRRRRGAGGSAGGRGGAVSGEVPCEAPGAVAGAGRAPRDHEACRVAPRGGAALAPAAAAVAKRVPEPLAGGHDRARHVCARQIRARGLREGCVRACAECHAAWTGSRPDEGAVRVPAPSRHGTKQGVHTRLLAAAEEADVRGRGRTRRWLFPTDLKNLIFELSACVPACGQHPPKKAIQKPNQKPLNRTSASPKSNL
eukprot:Rhum_TRINITY_DN6590_c0_g1::Rhum_TRINITY_DN6590_c0_g1_i1::g.20489::m.20489